MSVIIDARMAVALAVRQAAAGVAFAQGADKIAAKTAFEVKKEAARIVSESSQSGRLVHYPSSISYDREGFGAGGRFEYVVGPDKDRRQGALGNILEYGTSRFGPVIPHMGPALDSQAPIMDDFLAQLAESLA